MTINGKTIGRSSASGRLLVQGVASVDLNQRMTIARNRAAKGSVSGDWKNVGGDIKKALGRISSELETA